MVDARKQRIDRAEALKLARSVDRIIATRGRAIVKLDLEKIQPSDDELAAVLLGPTANLRAPAMRVGKTLVVGFNEAISDQLFRTAN